jgi:hypothetical protein
MSLNAKVISPVDLFTLFLCRLKKISAQIFKIKVCEPINFAQTGAITALLKKPLNLGLT